MKKVNLTGKFMHGVSDKQLSKQVILVFVNKDTETKFSTKDSWTKTLIQWILMASRTVWLMEILSRLKKKKKNNEFYELKSNLQAKSY